MNLTIYACGPAANESELKAIKHLEKGLQSISGDLDWVLLTNLAFSVNHQMQSEEIDIVAIGPSGVHVIEVKHWTPQWVEEHKDLVEQHADKVTIKARKIGTTLRRFDQNLPRVDGAFLLTQEISKVKRLSEKSVRGVRFHTLNEWEDILKLKSPQVLSQQDIQRLARSLEPKSAVAIDGSLKRLAGYINLELQTPKKERFHRIYKGTHSARQDQVILHLYDLSASDDKNSEVKARREFDALQRLQIQPWAPRILDSFQDAPGYAGEMFFFTVVDPAVPSLQERSTDSSWDTIARIDFSRNALCALIKLHEAESGDQPMVHRNLTPKTILVKHDNSPILTGFEYSRIPSNISVASTQAPPGGWDISVAPEVREQGLGAADSRSDVYSICACLTDLFDENCDEAGRRFKADLKKGLAEKPEERIILQDLEMSASNLLGKSSPQIPKLHARFWSEDQIVSFNGREYRIIARLGSGGVGTTFKVVEIDKAGNEELGTYVAKAGHNNEKGERVLKAYSLARSHLGGHPGLSTIFEVAKEWRENEFIALMTWVEGAPLGEFTGIFPLLVEEQQEISSEALALRWLNATCEALSVLHRNGLIHGDVSPWNLIVSGNDLVLTDFDFVGKTGEPITGPGTTLYSSPSYLEKRPASPSDDIYALAASFFHVVFDKEPFLHSGIQAKERGLNWEGLDRQEYPILSEFMDKATHPEPTQRFGSVTEALTALKQGLTDLGKPVEEDIKPPAHSITTPAEKIQTELREERVEWLLSLLQSYPGSRWGNRETRGLDTDFAEQTYVPTNLEETLLEDIQKRRVRLVILCGNAGDGKTALLQHLWAQLGLGRQSSSNRILEGQLDDGLVVRMNLDGSAAWHERSADELLDEIFAPFLAGPPDADIVHLLAINDGRLLEWIEGAEERQGDKIPLIDELCDLLEKETSGGESYIRFISLNQRSLVGGVTPEMNQIDTVFLERLLDHLFGGEAACDIWKPCQSCSAKDRCKVYRAMRIFGPDGVSDVAESTNRKQSRQRLYEALQAVHLRGETHITVRELRAALVYILFGVHYCEDYHNGSDIPATDYWDRAFSPNSPNRQGEVLRELARFDPALEAHPQIDRYLLSVPSSDSPDSPPHYSQLSLESARRCAYFEWTEDHIKQVAGTRYTLGLARGQHLRQFRNLPLDSDDMGAKGRSNLCIQLCKGISRLEDLPPQALDRPDVVPLRITPRTPTETAFWVEKPLASFHLEADLPPSIKGVDRLHRQAFLVYTYRDGRKERLRLGAELFHLLLELSEGYQLGDVSTDDTFAHLSIFIQRLVREDEREMLAWNPIQDETIYRISSVVEEGSEGPEQKMVLSAINPGGDQ